MKNYSHIWPQVSGHPLFASLAIPMAIFMLEKLIEFCKHKYQTKANETNDFEEIRKFLAGNTNA